jgi:hypothetical protein
MKRKFSKGEVPCQIFGVVIAWCQLRLSFGKVEKIACMFIFLKRTTGNRSKNDGCQPKVPRVEKNGYQPIRSQKKSSPTSPPKKP